MRGFWLLDGEGRRNSGWWEESVREKTLLCFYLVRRKGVIVAAFTCERGG